MTELGDFLFQNEKNVYKKSDRTTILRKKVLYLQGKIKNENQ